MLPPSFNEFLHAFWNYHVNEICMDRWTEGQTDRRTHGWGPPKCNASGPLKWTEA